VVLIFIYTWSSYLELERDMKQTTTYNPTPKFLEEIVRDVVCYGKRYRTPVEIDRDELVFIRCNVQTLLGGD